MHKSTKKKQQDQMRCVTQLAGTPQSPHTTTSGTSAAGASAPPATFATAPVSSAPESAFDKETCAIRTALAQQLTLFDQDSRPDDVKEQEFIDAMKASDDTPLPSVKEVIQMGKKSYGMACYRYAQKMSPLHQKGLFACAQLAGPKWCPTCHKYVTPISKCGDTGIYHTDL